ncbi:MAG TPA: glycosyltransferase family 4 protein [Planctomycetaceae bacterium]|nr:glycosyltransferase family 4 protein [Planctomycetaceae bacterium]
MVPLAGELSVPQLNPMSVAEIPAVPTPSGEVRPLRILVAADVPADPNSGAAGTVYQMNAAFRRLGHTVDEIWAPELGRRIQHGNLHYLLELPLSYRRALRRRLRHHEYDVVEFNQPHAYLAAAEFRRRRVHGVFVNRSHGHEVRVEEVLQPWRKRCGVPELSGVRGFVSRWLRVLLDGHWTRIAATADGFHVSSTEDATFLEERYGVDAERIGVVPQGVPDGFLDHPVRPMTTARLQRLLYVGQFAFVKAPQMVAAAVSTLLEKHPELTMTWVCSGDHHSAARDLLSEPARGRVTFLEWMPQDQLLTILDEHGIFLFPSFFEGFGKAPLEAMSRGLCVVASRTGGMRDFIEDGVSGRLTPIGEPEWMVDAVEHLLANPEQAAMLSLAARRVALHHRWERCAMDVTRFYLSLLVHKAMMATGRNPQTLRVPK